MKPAIKSFDLLSLLSIGTTIHWDGKTERRKLAQCVKM